MSTSANALTVLDSAMSTMSSSQASATPVSSSLVTDPAPQPSSTLATSSINWSTASFTGTHTHPTITATAKAPATKSSGLTGGEIAGIGIASCAVLICSFFTIIFFIRKHQKDSWEKTAKGSGYMSEEDEKN